MSHKENFEKPSQQVQRSPRRNAHNPQRPPQNPPGVEKALHFFGVPDLREFLNRKHEQAYFEEDKFDLSNANPPPSDPSYNYLKDPLRESESDSAKPPQKGKQPYAPSRSRCQPETTIDLQTHEKQQNVKYSKDKRHQQKYPPKQQVNDDKVNQDRHKEEHSATVARGLQQKTRCSPKQLNQEGLEDVPRGTNQKRNIHQKPHHSTKQSLNDDKLTKDDQLDHQNSPKGYRENMNIQRQSPVRNFYSEPVPPTTDTPSGCAPRGRSHLPFQNTFRGHIFSNRNRGRGNQRNQKPVADFIKNPVNIRIQLSTMTGERSFALDETTKIADIKHVPDNRPMTRGRGRGRGRGGSQRHWTKELQKKRNAGEGNSQIEITGNLLESGAQDDWNEKSHSKEGRENNEDIKHDETFKEFEYEECFEDSYEENQEVIEEQWSEENYDKSETAQLGENYESDLVKNLQESVVITAKSLKNDEYGKRSVEVLPKEEAKADKFSAE